MLPQTRPRTPGEYPELWLLCCVLSTSSTAGEKTIHALFHSHNHNDLPVFSPATLLLYLLVYYFLAILTYGVKVPSGLFVPGIICGSTFGRIVGEIVKSAVYESQHGDTCLGDPKCSEVRSCKHSLGAQSCGNSTVCCIHMARSAASYWRLVSRDFSR